MQDEDDPVKSQVLSSTPEEVVILTLPDPEPDLFIVSPFADELELEDLFAELEELDDELLDESEEVVKSFADPLVIFRVAEL